MLVIALPGVWCFKTREKKLIDDFKLLAWRDRDAFVIYDSDVAQKREVQAAENALAGHLDNLGATVHICRIPSQHKEKVGLDDYLMKHSPETFVEQILDRALIWAPKGNIAVESASDFLCKPIAWQEAIIGCGLLPAGAFAMVTAYSKEGKSIFVMNMAVCIASGKPFLAQFPVPRRRKVLYFQQEISEKSMQDRLEKMLGWGKRNGFDPGSDFELVNQAGIKIDTDEGIKTAMRVIRSRRPDVVIWDPLYKFHSQEENKSDKMLRVLDRFDYLRSIFGIAQVIVHHHGKPSKDGREGFQLMRGSSVFDAFGDSYFTLTRHDKNESSKYQRLSFTLRNAEAPADLIVYRNPETLWYEVVADADNTGKVSITKVVNILMHSCGHAKRQKLIQRLMEDCEASERTAVAAVAEAFELGRIHKRSAGKEVEYYVE